MAQISLLSWFLRLCVPHSLVFGAVSRRETDSVCGLTGEIFRRGSLELYMASYCTSQLGAVILADLQVIIVRSPRTLAYLAGSERKPFRPANVAARTFNQYSHQRTIACTFPQSGAHAINIEHQDYIQDHQLRPTD